MPTKTPPDGFPGAPDAWDDDEVARTDGDGVHEALYLALRGAFSRADAAAKAVARLEHDIAKELRVYTEQEAEELDEDNDATAQVAQESNRDFDDTGFNNLFDKINVLKLTSELADALNLDPNVKADVLSTMVAEKFGGKPASAPPRTAVGKKTVIGDDLGVFLHGAKTKAAREQASKCRNGG